jgi:hypothetical protein
MELSFHTALFRSIIVGPAHEFVLRHDGIYVADERCAAYKGGYWSVGGQHFTECRSDDRACIHAEREGVRTDAHGPVSQLHLVAGALYGDGALLWQLEPHGQWRRPLDSVLWDCIFIRQPSA